MLWEILLLKQIQQQIQELENKIILKQKEIGFEKDSNRKIKLQDELKILQLKKEIAIVRKRIKQFEGNTHQY